jgi:hypothetical protein
VVHRLTAGERVPTATRTEREWAAHSLADRGVDQASIAARLDMSADQVQDAILCPGCRCAAAGYVGRQVTA